MSRPIPEWTALVEAMKPEEVIVINTGVDLAAIRYHLRKIKDRRFICRTLEHGQRIKRVI